MKRPVLIASYTPETIQELKEDFYSTFVMFSRVLEYIGGYMDQMDVIRFFENPEDFQCQYDRWRKIGGPIDRPTLMTFGDWILKGDDDDDSEIPTVAE